MCWHSIKLIYKTNQDKKLLPYHFLIIWIKEKKIIKNKNM